MKSLLKNSLLVGLFSLFCINSAQATVQMTCTALPLTNAVTGQQNTLPYVIRVTDPQTNEGSAITTTFTELGGTKVATKATFAKGVILSISGETHSYGPWRMQKTQEPLSRGRGEEGFDTVWNIAGTIPYTVTGARYYDTNASTWREIDDNFHATVDGAYRCSPWKPCSINGCVQM